MNITAESNPPNYLAVTVFGDEDDARAAARSAESFRRRTGLETRLVDERILPKRNWARFHLFEFFPEADRILYFDPDVVCLREWDPRPLFAGEGLVAGRDRHALPLVQGEARLADVAPEQYFHSGLLLLDRERDRALLAKAEHDLGELPAAQLPHTIFNRARRVLELPIRWLPPGFFKMDFDAAEGEVPVVGKFRGTSGLSFEEDEQRYREWTERGFGQRVLDIPLSPGTSFQKSASTPLELNPEEQAHRDRLEEAVARQWTYPRDRFAGRGIVICGGGLKYLPCVWVCLRMLRELGCELPVEVWHLGEGEMPAWAKDLLAEFGARAVDACEIRKIHPVRRLAGWELKAFALLHCSFEEVLLLDADNVPVRDPSFLFSDPEYVKLGAVFWPDYGRLAPDRCIWRITGTPYQDEPEFESGQILVRKPSTWRELNVAMHFNEWSDFYYRHIHGDKETFHIAWRKVGRPYAMPFRGIRSLPSTMCQHDLQGRRLFQHRNFDKWRVWGGNQRIPDFQYEDRCFEFLNELRARWTDLPPGVRRWSEEERSAGEKSAAERLVRVRWDYHRVGHDQRPMTFLPSGMIGEGAAGCEVFWDIALEDGKPRLEVFGPEGRTFAAEQSGEIWRGRWERFEGMPVELAPLSTEMSENQNQ